MVRGGVRVGRPTLVVHALRKPGPPSRAGFVVSKAVGNAVTRNRVKRRLRHLAAATRSGDPPIAGRRRGARAAGRRVRAACVDDLRVGVGAGRWIR